jgi:cyclophilin family peptidyl-prolyl cis-trans isomerase
MKMVNGSRFVPAGLWVVAWFVLLSAPVSSFQHISRTLTGQTKTRGSQHHYSGFSFSRWMHHSPEDNEADNIVGDEVMPSSRRSLLQQSATAALLASLSLVPQPAWAATSSSPSAATTSTNTEPTSPSDATVTQKVYINVRISRQDGTFYVRDDLPDLPENKVFSGRLVIGLFGKNAPTTVERFLSYFPTIPDAVLIEEENPLPSYSRSSFSSYDQATGLLRGGKISSLEVTDIGGSTAIRYGGRLLPASLWIEGRGGSGSTKTATPLAPRVTHTAKGLLTHRILDVTPEFSITTRSDTSFLDGSHVVFGQLQNDDVSKEFLNIVQSLPTYQVDPPVPYMQDPNKETVVDDAAQAVFNAQRDFFRKAAKSLGDTRLEKVYEGKLLRRVEVTQVGFL